MDLMVVCMDGCNLYFFCFQTEINSAGIPMFSIFLIDCSAIIFFNVHMVLLGGRPKQINALVHMHTLTEHFHA